MTAKDAQRRGPAKPLRDVFIPLKDPRSWLLSLYYFLTFGGFVAMAIYLPILLSEIFGLTPQMAGMRTAGFVLLATMSRPIGARLRTELEVRRSLLLFSPLRQSWRSCSRPQHCHFLLSGRWEAVAIGLGNGAVFKLVPEYFPTSVGSVTGVVGAAGGLGGSFPPLLLGAIGQQTGSFTLGFAVLSVFCMGCLLVLLLVQGNRPIIQVPARN